MNLTRCFLSGGGFIVILLQFPCLLGKHTFPNVYLLASNGKIISIQHKMALLILANCVLKIFLPLYQDLELSAFRLQGT